MIGDLLLSLGVRVAAGGDARQQARCSEGMIQAKAVGRGAALGQGIPGVLRGIAVEVAPHVDPAQCREAGEVPGTHERGSRLVDPRSARVEIADEEERFGDARFGDRKSTRLNSSHLGISYAVFSL